MSTKTDSDNPDTEDFWSKLLDDWNKVVADPNYYNPDSVLVNDYQKLAKEDFTCGYCGTKYPEPPENAPQYLIFTCSEKCDYLLSEAVHEEWKKR